MGESAAETVREIEETRARLEGDIRELEDRLPAPAIWVKRVVGLAVGGGIGGTLFWFGMKRIRTRRRKKEAEARAQAVVHVIPEQWAEAMGRAFENGQWKGWLAGAGSIWLVLRLAEIRQLRKMNRMMMVSARPGAPAPLT